METDDRTDFFTLVMKHLNNRYAHMVYVAYAYMGIEIHVCNLISINLLHLKVKAAYD